MHPSALKTGLTFFETYATQLPNARVIDLGAQDINGSLKSVCPAHLDYTGVDFVPGKGVDVVLQDPYVLPFESESIDIVVCSSVFEHSEFFWLLFIEVMRVLKPSGLLYLNVPANGDFHRYPVDCWRFYPDAGSALVRWAEHNHIPAVLLESFIGEQDQDQWNDFVAVILKNRQHAIHYPHRILDVKLNFTNGKVFGTSDEVVQRPSDEFVQRRDTPEDRARLIEIRRMASAPLSISDSQQDISESSKT
jgi:SAM-dependent methyltransferase